MKKLRPLLAATLLLAAASPRASLVTTINVTTALDEDGSNPAACSLREAITSVNRMAPYGGCTAPNALNDNVIQLNATAYTLTRELYVEKTVEIHGKDSQAKARETEEDPLTGKAPRRVRPDFDSAATGKTGTYIVAAAGHRIFNTTASTTLKDMVLDGSATAIDGNGGVIFSGASLTLDNVIVRGGSVTGSTVSAGNGGAVYLGGSATGLTFTDVTLEGNTASNKGGAVAMLCKSDLEPYAGHTLAFTRVLLRGNASALGAGAIDICGNSSLNLTASTLSANSSGSGAGAVTYVQGSKAEIGQILFNSVTAAEQVGHVLALNGLANVQITGSLLSAFDTGSGNICHNPGLTAVPAIPWSANAAPTGRFNAVDDDGSCDSLLLSDGSNRDIVPGTPLGNLLVRFLTLADYTPAAVGAPYGLTGYYLPKAGSPILDAGEEFSSCLATDQRNLNRGSGTRCDIGAVERLVVTARDDKEVSRPRTDRLVIVDVLANDSFGEDDITGPYRFTDNAPGTPSVVLDPLPPAPGAPAVPRAPNQGCEWRTSDDAKYPGMLVVDNKGVVTPEDTPVVCTYRVVDTQGISSTLARVEVQVRNLSPLGIEDAYLRPVGTASITFNPLDNDTDEGDGKYGLVSRPDPANPGDLLYGPATAWSAFNPIEIDEAPQLGKIVGASSGLCPGSASVPRTCLTPPLRYVANNAQSPFNDSFTYRVHDAEGLASNSTRVTVYTDAPDPDHGGGAGSFDLLGGLLLGLLGLRRFLRL